MEGAEALSCQATASEHLGFGEDLQREVVQNPSQDLCKPAEKLQQTDPCACQQRFLYQVLSPIVLWIKYLFHVTI